eukprot:6917144-Pyramimonas_sp.AAC.1
MLLMWLCPKSPVIKYLSFARTCMGATITGRRLRHITGNTEHTVCPFCGATDEYMGHILFHRGHWDSLRAPRLEHYSVKGLLQLPVCLRQCGLMPDRPEYDSFFSELLPDGPDPPPPPRYEG